MDETDKLLEEAAKHLEETARNLAESTMEMWEEHKFPTESDEILFLVLKSHLLIEEKLDRIVVVNFGPDSIRELNLNFARKVILARAICSIHFVGDNWWDNFLWKAILELNGARNKLAHHLEHASISQRVGNLIAIYDQLGELMETSFEDETGTPLPRAT